MKNRKTFRFIALTLALTAAFALCTPAGAALSKKTLEVLTGVDIYVDGIKLTPKDANGKVVDAFVYEGTTYLPARAISEAVGKPIEWDGANQRVYIGKVPGKDMYLKDVCPPYQELNMRYYDYVSLAGNKYLDNMCFGWEAIGDCWALYNLNGQYNTLDFDVGHRDGSDMSNGTLNIYLDGELAYKMNLNGEMLPTHATVPLNGALQMKIVGFGGNHNYAIVNATIE